MFKPSLEEAKFVGNYNIIPVSTEMFSDGITPVTLLKKLKNVSGNCFILESAEDTKRWGRYTFLGFDPKMEITCLNGVTTVKTNGKAETKNENPNLVILDVLNNYKSAKFDYLPPFTGGLMGYFAYDYAKYCEPELNFDTEDSESWSDVDLMLFDKIIAFDNFRQKIILIVNISTKNLESEYENAVKQLEYIKDLIKNGKPEITAPAQIKSPLKALFSKDEFCRMVNIAKDYIKDGDISQVVLSNRFEANFEGSILDAYRVLRTMNPSPYMFYFSGSVLEIAGASPETLIKLQDGKLHTFPLAGTRPRGANEEEDISLEKDLLSDKKELSEHNMLVDLGRSDLGKISKPGSVKTEKYMQILRFSHVMHIGSEISGELIEGKTGLDAINAALPAGTLSGAPKIRAMQIINELEKNKRGIYGGAIGYLDFAGNMDTCIAIRIVYKKCGKVFIRSGAGIVADSNPESEYQECLNKAKAAQIALESAVGGIE
ncbi:MAG: anthranilate synthase component I family protein [Fibromonadaceae bacterium]|jgi:anthranilate synthase component 1|nr:anthranilate synthase component I family protein [Fibromonadaceae bacterium]